MASPKKKPTNSGSKPSRSATEERTTPARGAQAKDEKGTSGKTSRSAGGKNGKSSDDESAAPVVAPLRIVRSDLDRELIETIRAELLKKKLELGSNISSEMDEMREAAEGHHLADMDDLGGDAHDEETAYKIIEIESAALDQIDYALDRMANGTYGVCEGCEKSIAPERLKALPFVSLCINCKRQQEMGQE